MEHEIGDNLHLDVRARERATFDLAIQIAMNFHGPAEAYCIDKEKGLVLLWDDDDAIPFPTPLDAKAAADMAWAWLQAEWVKPFKDRSDKDCDPDALEYKDGDVLNERGFRVYNEQWGQVGDYTYAICAIQRAFIWLGK